MFTLILEDKRGGIADEYTFEEGEFYIGRSHTSDIVLPCDNVSRRHARLYTVDGKCYIEDLNSSNGVYVNGRRITEVFQIQRSAQIKIGDYYLHIESDSEPVVEEEKTWCKLVGQNYGFINQIFRITRKVNLLGRGKDCTITVIDPSVSRIHAKLSVDRSGALTLEDFKSSNGTFINDERIDQAPLAHGDLIRLGNVEFVVELPGMESTGIRTGVRAAPKKGKETVSFVPNASTKEAAKEAAKATKGKAKPTKSEPSASLLQELPSGVNPVVDGKAHREALNARQQTDLPAPSLADSLWPDAPKRRMWIIVLIAVAVLSVLAWLAFHFLLSDSPKPAPTVAEVKPVEVAVAEPKPSEGDSELSSLLAAGADYLKEKNWIKARERYTQALELDPLNDMARQALNRITAWEADQKRLVEARSLRSKQKRGEAAKLLREITDTSMYFTEAQEELSKLLAERGIIESAAEGAFESKDCETARLLWRELLVIIPNDPLVLGKLEELNTHLGTSRCTP